MRKKEFYYKSFVDDVVVIKNQDYKLPEDYVWIRKDFGYRLASRMIYILAIIFAEIYCRLILHVHYVNRKKLWKCKKTGYFLFANHTQEVGDVFIPGLAAIDRHIYTMVSSSNYGLPVIGKILPYLGALPIADNLKGMKQFNQAIKTRIDEKKCVVIYPEAHVWPYYTGIRPFADTAFHYPIDNQVPAYCMTVTYQKRRFFKRPKITAYIDGPFFSDETLSKKEQKKQLSKQVFACMEERSTNSNYQYYKYKKTES